MIYNILNTRKIVSKIELLIAATCSTLLDDNSSIELTTGRSFGTVRKEIMPVL
jgi:hypothetical protein